MREDLLNLVEENAELRIQIDKLLKRKKRKSDLLALSNLRNKVKLEDEGKRLFFEDLKRFKAEIARLRE